MRAAAFASLLILAAGCGKKSEEAKKSEPESKDPKKTAAPDAGGAEKKEPAATADAAPATPPAPAVPKIEGAFETPESVLYDETGDVYLVSNISGTPLDKDDKAFISRITPDGQVELKWIDSAKEDVTLNAPKGSAIIGETLYIADIDVVRMFDRATGAPKGEIAVRGAGFLNDVVAVGTTLWVSDTGAKLGEKGFEPSGTDAVFSIDTSKKNAVAKILAGADLGMPNGLAAAGGRITVVTFGTGEMYEFAVTEGGATIGERKKLPKGALDGIVIADGKTLVSSWEASAVYDAATGTEVVSGVESPADIGYDGKRKRLLIPSFMKNTVELREL